MYKVEARNREFLVVNTKVQSIQSSWKTLKEAMEVVRSLNHIERLEEKKAAK